MNKIKFIVFVLINIICIAFFEFLVITQNSSQALDSGSSRNALSTETIDLFIDPATSTDTTVMFRINFQNAEILNFLPQDFYAFPACDNQKFIENNKLCADFSQSTPFKKGDLLGKIIVKWGDSEDTASIIKDPLNGFFNGEETNYQSGILVEHNIIGSKSAIDANSKNRTIAIIFFTIGLFLLACGGYFLLKQKQKDKLANASQT